MQTTKCHPIFFLYHFRNNEKNLSNKYQKRTNHKSKITQHTVGFIHHTTYPAIQCWTEGRSSTAVAEGLRPTPMATEAEV
jgi:hypothetical protein